MTMPPIDPQVMKTEALAAATVPPPRHRSDGENVQMLTAKASLLVDELNEFIALLADMTTVGWENDDDEGTADADA